MMAVGTIHWFDSFKEETREEYFAMPSVNNFADVAFKLDEYYREDLVDINITLIDDETPFIQISKEALDFIVKEGYQPV